MRTYDLTPLWRSTVGFDRLFDLLDDTARGPAEEQHYPPYNIERTGEDQYQISLALAGFVPDEITMTAEQNVLTVEGRKAENADHQYLYQGHLGASFPPVFNLADYVQVKAASFDNRPPEIDLVAADPRGHEAPQDRDKRLQRQPKDRTQEGGLSGARVAGHACGAIWVAPQARLCSAINDERS